MKKLNVTFDGVTDTTGYLFSFAKCLSAALRCGGYTDLADDVIAASGFAFRMWADEKELCSSATSIWDFKQQKIWVENVGLTCAYVERMWHENVLEEERRNTALALIRQSIDQGFAPVAWDISGCEWGLIIGYENETESLLTLKISGEQTILPYEKLGRLEIPILSVLTVTGRVPKNSTQLIADTQKLAVSHLQGEEWCENTCGLAVYDTLILFVREKLTENTIWNLEYMLGTYAALKWYAWKFFANHGKTELAALYQTVHENWQKAFEMRKSEPSSVIKRLQNAQKAELLALEMMKK